MKLFKYILGIIFIASSTLLSCSSTLGDKSKNSMEKVELEKFCRSFVKSICTKDTLAFYAAIDADSLFNYFSKDSLKHGKINKDELYFPFFFIYSPLKIREQDLQEKRQRVDFFEIFKIDALEELNNSKVRAKITWKENVKDSSSQSIELLLYRKDNNWKVIGSSWDETK